MSPLFTTFCFAWSVKCDQESQAETFSEESLAKALMKVRFRGLKLILLGSLRSTAITTRDNLLQRPVESALDCSLSGQSKHTGQRLPERWSVTPGIRIQPIQVIFDFTYDLEELALAA